MGLKREAVRQIDALVYELYGRQRMRADKPMEAVVIRLSAFYPLQRGGVISEASVGSVVQQAQPFGRLKIELVI